MMQTKLWQADSETIENIFMPLANRRHQNPRTHQYARKAKVKLPPLEAYEKRAGKNEIIPLPFQRGIASDRETLSLPA